MIRKLKKSDRDLYINLAKEFYKSEAVDHTIPDKNFEITFDEMMKSNIYAEGFIFEKESKIAGYGIISKTFSQEAGGLVCLVEEIFIKAEFRNLGLGSEFLDYLKEKFVNAKRFRLEVTECNKGAIKLYKRKGFENLPYLQMIIDRD
jgi:ribosomal protein S18 acetylase RimI-like enzyme